MAYKLPDLPYAYDALEPHISEAIMRLHHDGHHQAYVDRANAALAGTEWADVRPKELLKRLDELPDDLRETVRDNAGGQYNHCLLWHSLSPGGAGQPQPGSPLALAIRDAFGSVAVCKETLTDAALSVFGSGWSWLAHDGYRVLVCTTVNQENPISDGLEPLLGIDVWEHAYYLQYHNRRADYVAAFLNVVDWGSVAERFDAAPMPDVTWILERPVSIAGKERAFGGVTMEEARSHSVELKALAGWGPMAKIGSIARAWSDLSVVMQKRGAATVADLDAGHIESSAKDLWIIPPTRSMV